MSSFYLQTQLNSLASSLKDCSICKSTCILLEGLHDYSLWRVYCDNCKFSTDWKKRPERAVIEWNQQSKGDS